MSTEWHNQRDLPCSYHKMYQNIPTQFQLSSENTELFFASCYRRLRDLNSLFGNEHHSLGDMKIEDSFKLTPILFQTCPVTSDMRWTFCGLHSYLGLDSSTELTQWITWVVTSLIQKSCGFGGCLSRGGCPRQGQCGIVWATPLSILCTQWEGFTPLQGKLHAANHPPGRGNPHPDEFTTKPPHKVWQEAQSQKEAQQLLQKHVCCWAGNRIQCSACDKQIQNNNLEKMFHTLGNGKKTQVSSSLRGSMYTQLIPAQFMKIDL